MAGSSYAYIEKQYSSPLAEALKEDIDFRKWFISKTKFSGLSDTARLMDKEQKDKRSKNATTWWGSHFVSNANCSCGQCNQKETDLLAVFECDDGFRFALHVEVKQPDDVLSPDQAGNYVCRAACWKGRDGKPPRVVCHDDAATILVAEKCYPESDKTAYLFDSRISHEEIAMKIANYPAQPGNA